MDQFNTAVGRIGGQGFDLHIAALTIEAQRAVWRAQHPFNALDRGETRPRQQRGAVEPRRAVKDPAAGNVALAFI